MSLEAMQRVVARVLTDPDFRERFLASSAERHSEYELTKQEFEWLSGLDQKKLNISSEGYVGKRFEHIESAFPQTLRMLDSLDPRLRQHYLETTKFPPNEEAESAAFRNFVKNAVPAQEHTHRFLCDLVDLESGLYSTPLPRGVPAYRFRPAISQPVKSPYAFRMRARGPFDAAYESTGGTAPPTYRKSPRDILVSRDGPRVIMERLQPWTKALLNDCDGKRTVHDLTVRHGPASRDVLERWLDRQVLHDTAPL